MKRLFLVAALATLVSLMSANAQKASFPKFKFTVKVENPVTSVKDQYRSGTCWAFSTISFVESEVIRINGITDAAKYPDFSEMFVVSKSYQDRADKYIRLDGNLTFAAGSEADDVLDVIRDYGIVPEYAMTGLNYGTSKHVHGELDAVTKGYVKAISENKNKTLSSAWKKGFTAIVDSYLGECPENFVVDGVSYTPASYRDALNFNPDDYITLTSFTHHPFYTWFAIEVCDNWRWDKAYNVPIDEFMQALDNALENGYTAAWGADVSEYGFTRNGIAMLVDRHSASTSGSDQARWVGTATDKKTDKKADKKADKKKKDEPAKAIVEINADQEYRQKGFDNKTITDDHGMHIYGIATNEFGQKFYLVKNSWGTSSKYKGIWYVSENYVKGQSLDIMIHKSALPDSLKERLGIK